MIDLKIGSSEPALLGIDLSLWLNAASIVVGFLIAAIISPWLSARSSKRDQQERILRVLLNTWQTPANADYQSSISLIPLDFKRSKRVLDARDEYMKTVNTVFPENEADRIAHINNQRQGQAKLISCMAKELNFDISPESLMAGAYISQGYVDREALILNALMAWQRIAVALEKNNDMFAATLSESHSDNNVTAQ